MDDLFQIVVPDEELAPPSGGFEPLPTGRYRTTLQAGTTITESPEKGWKALRIPFYGFTGKGGTAATLGLNQQITVESNSAKAKQIGQQQVLQLASVLGLTEQVGNGQKLTATSLDELIAQFDSMAGTEVEVYIRTAKRVRNGEVQLKDNGEPWIDMEIRGVNPYRPKILAI